MSKKTTTTIRIDSTTKKRLDKQPKASYDTIINIALDALEEKEQENK